MTVKTIRIECDVKDLVEIGKLEHFQGSLKTLTDEQAAKIRRSIEKHGLTFPGFVWRAKGGKIKIIDAHQRAFVVKQMIQDGWKLKKDLFPVVFVSAKNEREAKEKILLAASVYGDVDDMGMRDFIEEAGIEIEEMTAMIDIPDIRLDHPPMGEPKQPDLDEKMKTDNKCPSCGYLW